MVSTRVDATSKLKQSDTAVAAVKKAVAQHSAKLATARAQVKALRAKAIKEGTKAAKAALLKARDKARSEQKALAQVKDKARIALAEQRVSKVEMRKVQVEKRALARVDGVRKTIEKRRSGDLANALKKYEERWLKRRRAADARKIKASEAKAAKRIKGDLHRGISR